MSRVRGRIAAWLAILVAGGLLGCGDVAPELQTTEARRGQAPFGFGPNCTTVGGGGASIVGDVQPACEGCGPRELARMIDGQFGSYGSLTIAQAGFGQVRAKAQRGVVFPGGRSPGIVITDDYQDELNLIVTVSTYLDGELNNTGVAEMRSANGNRCAGCVNWDSGGPMRFIGIPAVLPYDEVEIGFWRLDDTVAREFRVHEICALEPFEF